MSIYNSTCQLATSPESHSAEITFGTEYYKIEILKLADGRTRTLQTLFSYTREFCRRGTLHPSSRAQHPPVPRVCEIYSRGNHSIARKNFRVTFRVIAIITRFEKVRETESKSTNGATQGKNRIRLNYHSLGSYSVNNEQPVSPFAVASIGFPTV